jgi:hypothetical protein
MRLNLVVCDALEDVLEIDLRIEPAELGGAEQGLDRRGTFAALVGTGEEEAFPAQRTTRKARSAFEQQVPKDHRLPEIRKRSVCLSITHKLRTKDET